VRGSRQCSLAIKTTATANPDEQFYAGAFWLLYGDNSSIHVPAFGLNSETSDPDLRWHPPDWRWSLIDEAHERVKPLYSPLLHLDVSPETFDVLWEKHIDVLAGASRRATDQVRTGTLSVPDNTFTRHFFVGIIDFGQGDAGDEYLARSVKHGLLQASGVLDDP
jgi:hypothetical protein